MGLMDTLRRRSSHAAEERHPAEPVACDHRLLLPRWNRLEDMGRDDLASNYQCEACNQVFSVEEAEQLRAEAIRKLHETV